MTRDTLLIPAAIIIAAGFIALAIYFGGAKSPVEPNPNIVDTAETAQQNKGEPVVAPISEKDHIRGNPNAQILLVEYSDFDCPFCKQFHETLTRIIEEYGPTGEVAWVYRQFPLQQLHPNAPKIAEASECVAELGGNEAFWKFSDLVFKEKPNNEGTDMSRLSGFAVTAGVDVKAFNDCLSSGRHTETIRTAIQDAVKAGGTGTPHTVILVGNQSGVINGAQPYDTVKEIVESVLKQIRGAAQPTSGT